LSDFRGKLVYIDLWATWCGPCLDEQPGWEKLVTEYKDQPVVFLGVSIDNTRTPWEKMVTERNLSGIQVWVKDNFKSAIMQHFLVGGIPRYILLDAEGKILLKNAPKPSGEIENELKKAFSLITTSSVSTVMTEEMSI
jgi:thiol-disulfide isomerase/thioredoxin